MGIEDLGTMIQRTVERILYRMALWASFQLKKRGSRYFSQMAAQFEYFSPENRPLPMDRFETTLYKANNEKGSESPAGQGDADRVATVVPLRKALPKWVEEITPFLANQLSPHTRIAYESDLKHFFRFLEGKISGDALQDLRLRVEHIVLYRR